MFLRMDFRFLISVRQIFTWQLFTIFLNERFFRLLIDLQNFLPFCTITFNTSKAELDYYHYRVNIQVAK